MGTRGREFESHLFNYGVISLMVKRQNVGLKLKVRFFYDTLGCLMHSYRRNSYHYPLTGELLGVRTNRGNGVLCTCDVIG